MPDSRLHPPRDYEQRGCSQHGTLELLAMLGACFSLTLAAPLPSQDPIDALFDADWRERCRIVERLVDAPDLDVLDLVPALVPEAEWTSAVGLGGGTAERYPEALIDFFEIVPDFRMEYPEFEPLLRSKADLVIAMSPSEAAMQILALRGAEQHDDVFDAIMTMVDEQPRDGLVKLIARRPERAVRWLRENPTKDKTLYGRAWLLGDLGEIGRLELRSWLPDPSRVEYAIGELAPVRWTREEAVHVLALLKGERRHVHSEVVKSFRSEQDPAVLKMVDAALDPFLESEDSRDRAWAAAVFARLNLVPNDARERLDRFARMLRAKSRDEQGCAAAALSGLAPRIPLDGEVLATLLDLIRGFELRVEDERQSVNHAAHRTLRGLGRHSIQRTALANLERELREDIVVATNTDDLRSAIRKMKHLGPRSISKESVEILTQWIDSADGWASADAVETLMYLGPSAISALPAIVRYSEGVQNSPQWRNACLAAWAISPDFARDEMPSDDLIGRRDENAFVDALDIGMDLDEHVAAVIRLLGDSRRLVRCAAIRVLLGHRFPVPAIGNFVPELLTDSDERVRSLALDLLWRQKLLGMELLTLSKPICDRLTDRRTIDAARASLALAAFWTGEVQEDALEPLLAVITELPQIGHRYLGARAAENDWLNPLALAQSHFLTAIESLPEHPSAIQFLEKWMSSEDPHFRRAANLARLRMRWR